MASSDEDKALRPRQFVEDFISYIERTFGDGQLEDASDKPYIEAVEGQFEDPSKRKALATVLLSQEPLHLKILDEVGEYLLNQVQEQAGRDFVVSGEATFSTCLYQQYQPWGVRKPNWPANCEVGLESQKYFFTAVKFGVKAPDGKRLSGDALAYASHARSALEGIAQEIPGGKRTLYWPWEQAHGDPYWGPEFAAKLVIHSPTGLVRDHPEIQELGRKFVEMALAVDKLLAN